MITDMMISSAATFMVVDRQQSIFCLAMPVPPFIQEECWHERRVKMAQWFLVCVRKRVRIRAKTGKETWRALTRRKNEGIGRSCCFRNMAVGRD